LRTISASSSAEQWSAGVCFGIAVRGRAIKTYPHTAATTNNALAPRASENPQRLGFFNVSVNGTPARPGLRTALVFHPRSGGQKLSSQKQRSHPRCACKIAVSLTLADHAELSGTAVNVGLGGMYVECETPPAFGSTVQVRFKLPSLDEDVVVDGTVRWVKADGVGVQFGSLRARDVWALNQLLRTVA
jgi:Tfp pilus assembly protein PilZ